MGFVNMFSMPPRSSTFCSRVSLATMSCAWASMAGESGAGACAAAVMQADAKNESNAKTKEKDVRRARLIGFSITRHTTAFGGSMYRRIPTWKEECKRECADERDTE